MNRLFQLISLICIMAITSHVCGQHEHWRWRTYNTTDGLSHSSGTCIAEDSLGFIWVGTGNGLSRFDGVNFSNFYNIEGDSMSLPDNRVRALTVNPEGNLLIGTYAGISIFDYSTGKFYSHHFDNEGSGREHNDIIRGFQCWPNGHTWVFTYCAVYDWNHSSNSFAELDQSLRCTNNGSSPFTLPTKNPFQCWLATEKGMALLDYKTQTATLIKPVGDVFTPESVPALIENCTMDRYGKIWYISINHATFYCYDPATNYQRGFKQEAYEYGRLNPISSIYLYADRSDRVWVSSWSTKPFVLDTITNTRRHFQTDHGNKQQDPHAVINYIFQSRNGDLWLAGSFGLRVHSTSMEATGNALLPTMEGVIAPHDQEIHCIQKGMLAGEFFIGTSNGLFRYNPQQLDYSFFRCSEGDRSIGVYELLWYNNELICGTNRGLFVFDPITGNFRRLPFFDERLKVERITALHCIGDELWVATRAANFFGCNLQTYEVKAFSYTSNDTTSTSPYFYDYVAADMYGHLWLANHLGYSCFDISSEKFEHVVPDPALVKKYGSNVFNMITDSEGMIWYGAFHGLFRINPGTGETMVVTKTKSQISKCIVPLFVDHASAIWFSTASGFLVCAKGSTELMPVVLPQAISSHYRYSKGVVLSNGMKVFVTNYEVLQIDQSKIQTHLTVQPPLINWFVTGDTSIVNSYKTIHLTADHNYFTFYFASPSAVSQSQIEYEYKLLGIDKEWVPAYSSRSASYNNLSGGEYKILVRARLAGSNWAEMKQPLIVNIALRFYETVLFKIAMIAAILTLLAIILIWRKRTQYRISQERAVASFIELSGEMSFDELCKYLSTLFVTELRFGLSALYLMDDENRLVLKSKQGNKELTMNWPLQIAVQDVKSEKTVSEVALGMLRQSKASDWKVSVLQNDEVVLGMVVTSHHGSSMSRRGDFLANEKLNALFTTALINHLAEVEMKKKEEMLEHINALLSESQLVSLRAQMNPHFVFNCLSSIQQCIVMKQYTEAGIYLNKFSRLFRMVLNNSSRSLITLKEEINVLTLYLELEHMRFQEKFEFKIDCTEDLDTEEVMIPSMLLQPFVENALWHGLMHKEADRKLDVRFYMRDEEVFVCEIEDNGIGRARAAEIKQQKTETKGNESKGIKISVDRLNLISMQQGKHAVVFFEDKMDEFGQSMGTLVRFELSAYLN